MEQLEDVIKITDTPAGLMITAIFMLIGVANLYFFVWGQIAVSHRWGGFRLIPFIAVSTLAVILSLLMVVLMGSLSSENVLLGLSTGAGIAISIVHPVVAVSFSLLCFILRPWEYLPYSVGMTVLPKGIIAVCFASWLFWCMRSMRLRFRWNGSCSIFAFFIIWMIIAALCGGTAEQSWSFFCEQFIPIIACSFLIFNSINNKFELRVVEISLIIAVLGITVAAEVFTLTTPEIERLTGGPLLGNSNDLASFIVMVLPFLFSSVKKYSLYDWSVVLIVAVTLLYGIVLADSRSAKLAIILMMVAYAVLNLKLTPFRIIMAGFVGVVVLCLLLRTSRSSDDLNMSSSSRLNYIVAGVNMVKQNPLFGVGLGNYPNEYEHYTSNFDEFGLRTAHSSWILIMSETGIFGLLAFISLFLIAVRKMWRMRHFRIAFLISALGYGFMMSTLSHSYLIFPYVLLALVSVAYIIFVNEMGIALKANSKIRVSVRSVKEVE